LRESFAGQDAAQRVPFINGPGHDQDVGPRQCAAGGPLGFGPVFGASPCGHGMSVKRERPVAVVKARNSRPVGASESKSMISR